MDDSIFIDVEPTQFQPGQVVSGKLLWALTKAPKEIRLELSWSTEGRCTNDKKIEAERTWNTQETSGEEAFEFTLPPSPYSFNGPLIALNWKLSVSVKKGQAECDLPITVSPNLSPVELTAIEDEGKRKSFSKFKS